MKKDEFFEKIVYNDKNEKKIKKCFLSQKKVVTCAKIEQLENFI